MADRRANDLDGRAWTRNSISVWNDLKKSPEEAALKHPAMFPGALAARLIESYSREGATVLDPFAGVGSTLITARQLGRQSIGIELNPDYAAVARERLAALQSGPSAEVIVDDARRLLAHIQPESIDLIVSSPPYWDILNARRTADYKSIRNYGELESDLGNVADYDRFLSELGGILEMALGCLKPGGYCCLIVMDIRKKDVFYPLHSDLATESCRRGFKLDDLIIWDRRKEYNNLRPLGYPAVFRINKIHEFIVVLQKPGDGIPKP